MDFREMAQIAHEEKINDRQNTLYRKRLFGETIYTGFKIWCLAFNNGDGYTDEKIFSKYLKEENISLTDKQRKHLLEKYFGYQCAFDNNGVLKIIKRGKRNE